MKQLLSGDNDYCHNNLLLTWPLVTGTYYRTLAASTMEKIDVPAGAKLVTLTAMGADAYARGSMGSPTSLAAVPSGDNTSGDGSIPLKDGISRTFRCHDCDSINVISSGTPVVLAEFTS